MEKTAFVYLRLTIHDSRALSLSLKNRLALLKKRLDSFVLVFGREAEGKEVNFAAKAFVQIRARGQLDGLFRHAERDRTLLGDAVRNLQGLGLEVRGGHDRI